MLRSTLFKVHDELLGIKTSEAAAAKRFVNKCVNASMDERAAIRDELFINLIEHCYRYVPYYKTTMDKIGMLPGDIKGVDDVKHFPLLTKDIIRAEKDRMISSYYKKNDLYASYSGGTTGEPIPSLLNKEAYYTEYYSYYLGLEWMGWRPGKKIVKLFGGTLGQKTTGFAHEVKNYMLNLDFMPAFELTSETARQYLETLIKTPGSFVLGYVSAVYELANHAIDLNIKDIRLGGAFVTAEQLPSEWAAVISKAFNCEAKAFYGCGEINSLGFQLKQDGAYRIPDFNAHLETVEMGSITDALAITSLHNYGKPLIRYVNGDTGIVQPASPGSGGFSNIEKLHGRSADFFKRANGEIVSPIIGTYSIQFTRIPVKKWQYVQKSIKDIEFRYQLLHDELSAEQRQSIVDIFTRHLDSDVNIHFINTNDFIVTPNGKHRLVVIQC